MAWIPLLSALAATATLLLAIGAMVYFVLLSLRRDRHSPPTG